jgi:hypothetical protein
MSEIPRQKPKRNKTTGLSCRKCGYRRSCDEYNNLMDCFITIANILAVKCEYGDAFQ